MKLNKVTLLCLLAIFSTTSNASLKENHSYLGYSGQAPGISLNYERHIYSNLWLGIGLSYYSGKPFGDDMRVNAIGMPAYAAWLWGESDHKFETSAGFTYVTDSAEDSFDSLVAEGSDTIPVAAFGYRYMPSNGFTLRAIASPMITDYGIRTSFGVSVGYVF